MRGEKNDLKKFDYSGTLSTSNGGTLSTSNDRKVTFSSSGHSSSILKRPDEVIVFDEIIKNIEASLNVVDKGQQIGFNVEGFGTPEDRLSRSVAMIKKLQKVAAIHENSLVQMGYNHCIDLISQNWYDNDMWFIGSHKACLRDQELDSSRPITFCDHMKSGCSRDNLDSCDRVKGAEVAAQCKYMHTFKKH